MTPEQAAILSLLDRVHTLEREALELRLAVQNLAQELGLRAAAPDDTGGLLGAFMREMYGGDPRGVAGALIREAMQAGARGPFQPPFNFPDED